MPADSPGGARSAVQGAARDAQRFKGGPHRLLRRAEACWWWAKHYLRFKHHGEQFEVWRGDLGDPRTKLQLLIAPDVLVRMNRMEGDCAIYTMMLAAMLEALGLQWQIVTAAVDRTQPEIFSHVWPRVVLPGGTESLDASHGQYPGWQVPSRDIHRAWVFDANGSRIAEQGARFNGPARITAGNAAWVRRCLTLRRAPITTMAARRLRRLPPDTSTSYFDYGQGFPAGSGQYSTVTGTPYSGTVYQAPSSQTSAQWATFATNLAKMGFTLAQINAIQPGTVVSANGAILRQNPGYAVGTPTGSFSLGTSSISTTALMVGGLLLLGALFMFSGRR